MPHIQAHDAATRYINRELSWLDYDARVLELAADSGLPLFERVKFCAIFSHMLDEFFMVRVAGLEGQVSSRLPVHSPDGRTPAQALDARYGGSSGGSLAPRSSTSRFAGSVSALRQRSRVSTGSTASVPGLWSGAPSCWPSCRNGWACPFASRRPACERASPPRLR